MCVSKETHETALSIYQENGFENRAAYLADLADQYGEPQETVEALADMLGEGEDFDGLVNALEDGMGDC